MENETFLTLFNFSCTPTYHLWKPTLAKKMVSINGNRFPIKGGGYPLQGNGFPSQGVSINGKLVYC
jgi:hypothetical protein